MKQQKRFPDTSDWDDTIITPITLKMKKGTWEIFKELTPRKKKLNDAVVDLIHKFIMENSEEATQEELKKFLDDQKWHEEQKKKKQSKKSNGGSA